MSTKKTKNDDIMKLDLYELFAISVDATAQEIKSAYRRLALSCHPDKNPDNPAAVERFHRLSKALEILTDETAKSAYDRLLKSRKANVLRNKRLDEKRQKMKDKLEEREKAAQEYKYSEEEAEERLQREIERLRKDGSKQLETENELLRQQIEEEMKQRLELELTKSKCLPKLKVSRKSKTFDFREDSLRSCLQEFGEINAFVLTKNQKKALIEFNDYEQTVKVFDNRFRFEHLFTIEWIGDRQQPTTDDQSHTVPPSRPQMPAFNASFVTNNNDQQITEDFSSDYESLVLRNMRAAEERKRLIRQLEEQEVNGVDS